MLFRQHICKKPKLKGKSALKFSGIGDGGMKITLSTSTISAHYLDQQSDLSLPRTLLSVFLFFTDTYVSF